MRKVLLSLRERAKDFYFKVPAIFLASIIKRAQHARIRF
jgi:hypothetical protein